MDNPDKNDLGGLAEYTKHGCLSQIETVSFGNMYKIMLASFLALPFSFMLGPIAFMVIIAVLVLSISVFIKGIVHQRKKSKGEIIDDGYIKAAIIMPLILMSACALVLPAISIALSDMFSMDWRYKYSDVFFEYAEKNDGKLPLTENWCDILARFETEHNEFKYKKDMKEGIRYALNKNALGLFEEIPDDMVLMFSSKPGWNQVGGPEIADGQVTVKVIYANKESEKVRKKHLSHLRWSLNEKRTYPTVNKHFYYIIAIIFLITSAIVIFKAGTRVVRYWLFILLTTIASAILGSYFSNVAEEAFYDINRDGNSVSYLIGSITGLLAGLAFAMTLAKRYSEKTEKVSIVGFATVTGAITGIIASSFTHAFLMTAYVESNPMFMLCGIPFGVLCGIGLGWISSGLIKLYNKTQKIGDSNG
ncbi:MAG: hypothetical protein FVQ82_01415 [Planctomycetes bacterium]|nr:hypothetical protein [Planctomycetota bacterium]